MSGDDFAACRQRLEDHLKHLIDTKADTPELPVTENECGALIEDVQKIWTRNHEAVQWTLDPSPADTALRELLLDLISVTSITDPEFLEVWYLIDTATILADNNLSEPPSNFILIETLLDSQTVSGCRKVFDYLESRRDMLLARNFEKKTQPILRCFNELLRRLSRAEDAVFCGRVFIFLFQSFQLGDKSSVNLRGEFHTENVTHYDPAPRRSEDAIKPMEIDTDGGRPASSGGQTPASLTADADASQRTGRSTPIPAKSKSDAKAPTVPPPDLDALFPQFWSLQALFSNPKRLFESAAMAQFRGGMAATLSCFKSLSTTVPNHSAAPERGLKRKRNENDGSRASQPYNPKYLTSRDLFDLEVHDTAFRRHILMQCLIMLEFLLSLSATAKKKMEGCKNASVQYPFTLSEDDVNYCQTMRQSIATYLQQQGPGNDGKHYYRMVDSVLSRDKNWVRWKAEACPLITKDALEFETIASAQKTLCDMTAKKPFANPPGANDFGFLSMAEPMEALKHPSKRQKLPSLEEYYEEIERHKLDEDFATGDEKKELQEKIQGSLWRALRESASEGQRFELCEKIKDGANTKALVGLEEEPAEEPRDDQARPEESQDRPAEAPTTNGHDENSGDTANTPKMTTQIPQMDGSQDVPGTEEGAVHEESMSKDEKVKDEIDETDEFAPPGTMDVDDPTEVIVDKSVEVETLPAPAVVETEIEASSEITG